jgi:putative MATE family efflux protein
MIIKGFDRVDSGAYNSGEICNESENNVRKKEKTLNRDLTVGKPESVLWRFCLPLFGSIIFQQLYNLADSLVAGKFIGENALAAVGNSYEITLIFIAFAFGCNMGCSVVVSQFFGAKDYLKMKTAVYTALISSAVVCLVLMVIGILGCGGMLRLINTPEEILADSKLYLDIYVWGLPFMFFYNIATGIFSALGDSRTPFNFLAVSSTANILVDILFVTKFGMGVDGVAWATFLCQGISCVMAVTVVLRRLGKMEAKGRAPLFSLRIFRKFVMIAVPSILQQSFVSVGNIIIQSVINGFGAGVIAGYSAAVKLNNLVISSYSTLANGISNYTAQNLGAGKLSRVREGFRAGIKIVWILTLPLFVLYFFGGRYVLYLFLDEPTGLAVQTGITYLRILAPFYFAVSAKLIADGVLRGASLMKQFMIGTFADLILRVVLAWAFSRTSLGATGIWCAWPIGWVISTTISLTFYRRGPWIREKEEIQANADKSVPTEQ